MIVMPHNDVLDRDIVDRPWTTGEADRWVRLYSGQIGRVSQAIAENAIIDRENYVALAAIANTSRALINFHKEVDIANNYLTYLRQMRKISFLYNFWCEINSKPQSFISISVDIEWQTCTGHRYKTDDVYNVEKFVGSFGPISEDNHVWILDVEPWVLEFRELRERYQDAKKAWRIYTAERADALSRYAESKSAYYRDIIAQIEKPWAVKPLQGTGSHDNVPAQQPHGYAGEEGDI